MILENCAEPNLGCCILLRGGSLAELTKVKKVVKFLLLAYYNWKLERAFLHDIETVLPEPGMNFDDLDDEETKDKTTNDEDNKSAKLETDNQNDPTEKKSVKLETDQKVEDKDDPLQKKPFVRKVESDKNLSCGVPIRDFSDPLRASQMGSDDEVFAPVEEASLKADSLNDRWSTDDVVLSMSPNIVVNPPYLQTEVGRACPLRRYYPEQLFPPPPALAPPPAHAQPVVQADELRLKELHPFLTQTITAPADDNTLRASLAHYRATGCRLADNDHTLSCPMFNPSILKKEAQKETQVDTTSEKDKDKSTYLDPLAPENHQVLSLLFYSFSNKSANVPDFCVNPWIMNIDLYGRRDITLGAFLEKYCFNGETKCPSTNCQVPMNQHVRRYCYTHICFTCRFVHEDVCIQITCNTIGHSNVDKVTDDKNNQVMFWSRCTSCGRAARARRLSSLARSLSLAQYISLRARAPRLLRAACEHPAQRHDHYFATRLTTACFKYSKITMWDISLPPAVVSTRYDTRVMRDALVGQLNELMLKAHETFSALPAGAAAELGGFKQLTETLQLSLASPSLHPLTTPGVVRHLWSVSDKIIAGEKMVRDLQEKWASPAKPVKAQDIVDEKSSDLEDSGAGETSHEKTDLVAKDETDRPGEEDEEKGDKKTVRQILAQLLSNNQPCNQAGMIISHGLLPVVVFAGEIGSVIAAALASVTYQRSLHTALSQHPDQEESDVTSSGKEDKKTDSEKTKAAKTNDHIEVQLKDGLLCRVYYAKQFHKLRHMLLAPLTSNPDIVDEFSRAPPSKAEVERCCTDEAKEVKTLCDIEEGFIRSLAHCVPWAALGGKSGSTFCKTKDDRYVLKEMTKPEWQQFLEFAPHYFNHVIHAHQNTLPTLLARILGVFSVGGAGNGVLVMENLLYGCPPQTRRFDLKGSSRPQREPEPAVMQDHYLLRDTSNIHSCVLYGCPPQTRRFDLKGSSRPQREPEPAVMQDHYLLRVRWETQFYVYTHAARVLFACIERDAAFLATHCVMDYSLLLGVTHSELLLGLIDYIRTFTWDKKLEHYVKKNLRSGQPTVVSPEQYRRRFLAAMRKYFMQCPDHWDRFYTQPVIDSVSF
ncbi:putative 1-phosphatidylinositol 3-phosphate 5-kinase [Plutella xylostella]|uniref:putative 1-phosphatidylinositol 3-phosphate 5-kinase n=1 Tax=Plutella xylostella TaxID=51655 RepID=UPI002033108C|nr:putative 1-phosphatidylinositol 3-phosphate 5-kinase [Plutella xylostella]